MFDLLLGAAGAVLALAAFLAGRYVGMGDARRRAPAQAAAGLAANGGQEQPSAAEQERVEREKLRMQQEQQAYLQMLNFSAEQAYGLVADRPLGRSSNGVLRGDDE